MVVGVVWGETSGAWGPGKGKVSQGMWGRERAGLVLPALLPWETWRPALSGPQFPHLLGALPTLKWLWEGPMSRGPSRGMWGGGITAEPWPQS